MVALQTGSPIQCAQKLVNGAISKTKDNGSSTKHILNSINTEINLKSNKHTEVKVFLNINHYKCNKNEF